MSPARVLFVGGAAAFRDRVSPLLSAGGHVTEVADTLEACREVARRLRIEVALVGGLGGQDALATCGALAAEPGLSGVSLLLVCEPGAAPAPGEMLTAGALDFVEESEAGPQVLARIASAARAFRRASRAERRLAEADALLDIVARLNRSLDLPSVLNEIAATVAQFGPHALWILSEGAEKELMLRVFCARPVAPDSPRVAGILASAQALMGRDAALAATLIHLPTPWPDEPVSHRIERAVTSPGGPLAYFALETAAPLDAEDAVYFRALVDRLEPPLQSATRYEADRRDNAQLSERFRALSSAQAERVAAERLTSIGQLAAGVAHEINNPLAFVISNLNVLRDYTQDLEQVLELYLTGQFDEAARVAAQVDPHFILEDLRPLIEESIEGSTRVHNIVRKLRGFTHMQGVVASEELGLPGVVESVLGILKGQIPPNVSFAVEVDALPRVRGDRGKLSQAFINLVNYLVNAVPPDRAGHLVVRGLQGQGEVGVELAATGPRVSPEQAERIFEPFAAATDISVGGLDLAIANEIIRRHQGRVDVESHPGEGVTFRVWLPARNTLPLPVMTLEAPIGGQPRGNALFVDDERLLLSSYQRAFGRTVHVHLAHGGAQAIEMLGALSDLDVVLCDLAMPQVDGPAVYAWICAHRPELQERFVVITGGSDDGVHHGFVDGRELPIIKKPFDVQAVAQMIARYTDARLASSALDRPHQSR